MEVWRYLIVVFIRTRFGFRITKSCDILMPEHRRVIQSLQRGRVNFVTEVSMEL